MNQIILYTKKIPLVFDENSVCIMELDDLIKDIQDEYMIMDNIPAVHVQDNFQYITFRVAKKKPMKGLGFHVTRG